MNPEPSTPSSEKFHQAGIGFFILNIMYVGLVYYFLPPFNLGLLEGIGYTALALALFGSLSYFIYKGSRKLTVLLMAIYTARAVVSIYTLATEQAFVAVPYVLPGLVITVYVLGRPLWDWP